MEASQQLTVIEAVANGAAHDARGGREHLLESRRVCGLEGCRVTHQAPRCNEHVRLAARSCLPAGEGHELGVRGREGAERRRGLPALGPGRAERRAAAAQHRSGITATKA